MKLLFYFFITSQSIWRIDAIEFKDLVDYSQSDYDFTPLTNQDFDNAENVEEIDVKQVIIDQMTKDGKQLSEGKSNFLDNPLEESGQFEGDIKLPSEAPNKAEAEIAFNAIRRTSGLWTRGVIPYVVSSQFGSYARKVIASAILDFHKKTCLQLIPRTDEDDYIRIKPIDGCYSYVGAIGGSQDLSLTSGCIYKATIIHELMHAAGFYHEQARYDRDQYVTIHWDNIKDGHASNFKKQSSSKISHLGTSYDYHSVMHYSADAFSKYKGWGAQGHTISAKNGESLGNDIGFSANDIVKVNKLYKCGNEDEYIYSGDQIALKNLNHTDRWLSCFSTWEGGTQDRCKLSNCIGTEVDDDEWSDCAALVFTIYAHGRGPGEPIRWNEHIALLYWPEKSYWLSCDDVTTVQYCTTRTCPGPTFEFTEERNRCGAELFWIYAPGRQDSCDSDVWKQNECRGDPIKSSDAVFIWADGTNGASNNFWLSGKGDGITTSSTPGQVITDRDVTRAPASAWEIVKRVNY